MLIAGLWKNFLYSKQDVRIVPLLRILYSVLLIVNILVLGVDLNKWYGPNSLMPYQASRLIVDPDTISIFDFLPDLDSVFSICYGLFLFQAFCLLVGFYSKINAACCFIWLFSFHHRNIILFDGEDTLFRLICFLFIFLPLDFRWSLSNLITKQQNSKEVARPLFALQLLRIQMSLLMFSSVIEKLRGDDWISGDALYYASRLDDLWGYYPIPEFIFNNLFMMKLMTWGVLLIELFVPFAVWFRKTKNFALIVALMFHLAIEYAMNLFLFHWLMIVGWLSFCEYELIDKTYKEVVGFIKAAFKK